MVVVVVFHIKMGGGGKLMNGEKNLSPNQGDGMASMRRKSFAVRIIVGAGVCLY